MNALDLLIVVLVLGAAAYGYATGMLEQVGGWLGLLAGLALGSWLAPTVVTWASDPTLRAFLVLFSVILPAGLLGATGALVGRRVSQIVGRARIVVIADRVLGALVSAVATLVVVWLVAGSVAVTRTGGIGPLVQDSAVVRALADWLPPAPEITARLERLIEPLGFPRVFAGLEPPIPDPVAPPLPADVAAAVARAAGSTVRVESRGCGGLLVGSGFVAGAGLVVTNAHVVAGAAGTVVQDAAGTHTATPVLFDARRDLAVLRARGLAGPPLALAAGDAPRGSTGAVLGYPGGGGLTPTPAAVLETYDALGRDIYGQSLVTRRVYSLQATVRPGNSGGPFVRPDGTVAGIVFARSVVDDGVGYALVASEAADDVARAATAGPVSTGACVAD